MVFNKVFVEAEDVEIGDSPEDQFDFEGVTVETNVQVNPFTGTENDGQVFVAQLLFRVLNETGRRCPYKLDFSVSGVFEVVKQIDVAEREVFVAVNGTTLLFGAIREQVSSITARSGNGLLLLPTVNFLDLKKPKVPAAESPAAPQVPA
jgi:preprotein translocase subunit SecB